MVADLRRAAQEHEDFPPLVLFHLGTVEEGERFFAKRWPEVRTVSDPDAVFYQGFELQRLKLRSLLSPAMWGRGLQAFTKGHGVGAPVGDPLRMPGLFLVDGDGAVRWSHRSKHTGDHPDLARLPALAGAE